MVNLFSSLQNESVPTLALFAAILSAAIWIYLAIARGNFFHLRPFDDDLARHTPPPTWPSVTAIVPARNEAATIAQSIASVLQQSYPGEFRIILIDDHSEDPTAKLAEQAATQQNAAARVIIHHAAPLPQNWTGKLWALNEGVTLSFATGTQNVSSRAERPKVPTSLEGICFSEPSSSQLPAPDYFWFTDADIIHAPDTLARLVSRAKKDNLDLTSLMVLLQAKTIPEQATIPAFLFFFLKLYPPRWIANAKARTTGAAGGCILLRREALERIGGFSAIRSEVIDDCALARAVKNTGGKIWMGLTRASISFRAYNSFAEVRDMIARTAFTQLRYSALLLLGTIVGLMLTYLAPIALLFAHNNVTRTIALLTWLTMSLLFLPTIRFYRLLPHWAPLLPLTAAFYAYATFLSAIRYYANRGAQWKGRSQVPQSK
jgi:cellulose synthase/poly-beta-1,6-N-acetylglucosamine synthase-like glycosyltransferase